MRSLAEAAREGGNAQPKKRLKPSLACVPGQPQCVTPRLVERKEKAGHVTL